MSEMARDSSTSEEKTHKPNCERNVSGELDVFEATRYFSDFNEPTMIQIHKQSIVTENRQKRVHPETEEQLPKPRVVVIKPQKKEMTRGGGKKLTSFLNSLLRSAGLKKSKSTTEVETPRGERMRRKSCVVTTHVEASSPISCAGAWSLNARRRSFDEKDVKDLKKSDQKLNIRFCESLYSVQRVECKNPSAGDENDVNGGCESDSSSESDLFELDLFAKTNP
ncbi:unnamed protein product [Arabidopsis lyrata]|uniref:Uncharacterized protein n=1 Tax=Arabidopsis lyrata subsp. lyrata TaxID=81972 RepID=D7KQI5_ARALL|nr:uncharacterized protein LOC9328828 [Arabidopsis lyrata subsp. lyrata]EFH66274.1 hypothetical protein ARALYDRAFT_888738 [Arabidopsis lyrata subsp. lyrata]CAH8252218.1 unnamed protein product [Arabidopsis lyrata]|eukprot:XP_002890015.1 uncharacterized protein LOC9328828 [Arabidopsis lyrata subsp. lyrata]